MPGYSGSYSGAGGGGGGAPAAASFVTVTAESGIATERVLTGTANQIVLTDAGINSTLTLSTPQDIATGSSVTFGNVTLGTGGALRTGTTAGNTLLIRAYDTNTGPAYTTFITLTANDTPTCDLSTAVTMGGNAIAYAGSSPSFAAVTVSGATASRLLATDGSKALASVADLTSWVGGTANQIVSTSDGDGTITLSTPQDIATSSSPTFANLTIGNAGALRTTTTSGHTLLIQAYDNDTGPGYTTFITLTAGNTPTCDLSTSVTMGGAAFYTVGGQDISVADGGTGLSSWTANSLVYASASTTLASLGAATNGQIPIGSTGAAPVLATITGTSNQITVGTGAGSITLSTPQNIHTAATPTFASVLVGDGSESAPTLVGSNFTTTGLFWATGPVQGFAVGGAEWMRASGTEVVVNEDGDDRDFRIESDQNANMFVIDAAANTYGAIGIGAAIVNGFFINIANTTFTVPNGTSGAVVRVLPALTTDSSGTHSTIVGFAVNGLTLTLGGAAITNVIGSAFTGPTNYAGTAINTAVNSVFTTTMQTGAAAAPCSIYRASASTLTLAANQTGKTASVYVDQVTVAGVFAYSGGDGASIYVVGPPIGSALTNSPSYYAIWADTGNCRFDEAVTVGGALDHDGSTAGFFGVTPASRASAYTQTYSTADKTHANFTSADLATTAATQTTPWGFASQAQADNIATQFNLLRADVADAKALINSVIDDLQTYGLFQ